MNSGARGNSGGRASGANEKAIGAGRVSGKEKKAEVEGFEPPEPRKGFYGFRDRPIRPLWHTSGSVVYEIRKRLV